MGASGYEARFLAAAAPELKTYLLSDEIYWNLGLRAPSGEQPYPQFTLGWLLLFRRRFGPAETPRMEEVLKSIEATAAEWRTAWRRKAAAEFGERLNLWAAFMNEMREDAAAFRRRYAYEVQRRTMLSLLEREADDLPAVQVQLLRVMDAGLREVLRPAAFIGPQEQARRFPREHFWFLYGVPGE